MSPGPFAARGRLDPSRRRSRPPSKSAVLDGGLDLGCTSRLSRRIVGATRFAAHRCRLPAPDLPTVEVHARAFRQASLTPVHTGPFRRALYSAFSLRREAEGGKLSQNKRPAIAQEGRIYYPGRCQRAAAARSVLYPTSGSLTQFAAETG